VRSAKRATIAASIALVFFFPLAAGATIVVTAISEDEIVVGADALWRSNKGQTAVGCKIDASEPRCTFAIAANPKPRSTQRRLR